MHTIRDAVQCDAIRIAPHIRQGDKDELKAVGWTNTVDPLVAALELSIEKWCALDSTGQPAVLFGVAPSEYDGVGLPWMLATDYILTVPKETLRQTRRYVQRMHSHFPILTQLVDFRNVTSVGWMQWLGFQINKVVPRHGVEQRPFIHFIRRDKSHV